MLEGVGATRSAQLVEQEVPIMQRTRLGSLSQLRSAGCLTGKVGSRPVCVFWADDQAFALDDRCPHMGFPLHRGTVENGLLTCHWHHARFDLASGGTLDPFADDVRIHHVEIEGDDVFVELQSDGGSAEKHLRRLEEGLEQGLNLVIAKAVLDLFEDLGPTDGSLAAFRVGTQFGIHNRDAGWGAGLTVLTAMMNVLPVLDPSDRCLALVHGLAFVSRDTRGRPPRFPLSPLPPAIPFGRLSAWYRRFLDTRNGDAAERVLATAAAHSPAHVARMMGSAITDHLFIDGGHTIDFTNKAFEALDHLGWEQAAEILPTLAHQSATASRSEETGTWRHPDDLAGMLASIQQHGAPAPGQQNLTDGQVDRLAWALLDDQPDAVMARLDRACHQGASYEQLARAVAYAAALRMVRFHTQNDHADWDEVHHGFTAANAVHQLLSRSPDPELARGIYQVAAKVFLDRFLNVPAARLPARRPKATCQDALDHLQECWDHQGMVDEAGATVYHWVRSGGDQGAVIARLGSALLAEDAEFHWFQTYEAAVRQANAWPAGGEQAAMILAGAARFLAAHTPTRRELAQVVRIATRLRRGEALYEEL
jgi:nitrite reductase/ring-hydroxylating ferredoxin subunit/folate-dependent phosphoribosylglycinamide formyltransferase PurN